MTATSALLTFATNVSLGNEGREEQIFDDDGNGIIMKFPNKPTVETYEFLKDYLEFRIQRMRRALKARISEDIVDGAGSTWPS